MRNVILKPLLRTASKRLYAGRELIVTYTYAHTYTPLRHSKVLSFPKCTHIPTYAQGTEIYLHSDAHTAIETSKAEMAATGGDAKGSVDLFCFCLRGYFCGRYTRAAFALRSACPTWRRPSPVRP